MRIAAKAVRLGAVLGLLISLLAVSPGLGAEPLVIMFSHSGHDLQSFKPYAELAATFKSRGRVQIGISDLADKDWRSFPPGGCPWREYACYVPAPWMFYPHPKIAPFIDPQFVAANRKLMLERAEVVKSLGLEAIFEGKNSHYLPEAFFQKYPQYRGPRVDHPRRSNLKAGEAFSMCLDQKDTREMVSWMMAEIKRNVPVVTAMVTGTNDAGAGLCWAAALYPGPNGPEQCKGRNAGERVRDISLAIHRGAVEGGGDITLHWGNVNFWQNEEDVVRPLLPENTFMDRSDPAHMGVGTMINEAWPFLGLVDVLGAIQSMERLQRPGVRELEFGCSAMYSRGDDTPQALGKLMEIAADCMDHPTNDLDSRLAKLRELAGRWGGEANRDKVFQALYDMNQAISLKNALVGSFGGYSNFYCGVSMRHLTRPLVIKPELLTKDEEAYFLPYVFNPRESEARMDYIDFHGGRMHDGLAWENGALHRALSMADRAGRTLQNLEGAPEGDFLKKMGLSLRMWASEVRSIHNFYNAQLLRDKYATILAGAPRVPSKEASWDGDPGNLEWNAIMRDEFDNTNELIALLEDGGLEMTARAKDPRYEDTFLLGPNLIEQLHKKTAIMRAHWLDVQDYLAPPLK
ncbi:hypothetical protein LLH00_08900 [bacterium]|nr:hypothetical protein [bacterium]